MNELDSFQEYARYLLETRQFSTEDDERLLRAIVDPGGAVEVYSESIGTGRHHWIGEDQWGEEIAKKEAPVVLYSHQALSPHGYNHAWIRD